MSFLGTRAAESRVLFVLVVAGSVSYFAPGSADAQGAREIRVPDFRVSAPRDLNLRLPIVRIPDVRVPVVHIPRVRAPLLPVVAFPDLRVPQSPAANLQGGLVFHGNYCGLGNRGRGLRPVDALDAACMRHDACTPPPGSTNYSCGCNGRLQRVATAVAMSPRTPEDTRAAARLISEGMKLVPCR